MAVPAKPWEVAGVNFRSDTIPLSMQSSSKVPEVNVRSIPSGPTIPPPLPPRPTGLSTRKTTYTGAVGGTEMYRGYPSSSGYMNTYGNYGGYGNMGMYGNGYGGYGTAYSGYPYYYHNGSDNRLIALAEETTRPAFESIESVVRAFRSVSFMLESTLGALHASFRAALGVADHLSHLRNILSALSIFRLLHWCSRQMRRLLGQRYSDGSFNGVWGEAAKFGDKAVVSSGPSSAPSQWPLRIFIGIVVSVSYLAWKLLSYIVGTGGPGGKGEESEAWVQGKEHGCQLAVASYNFTATMDQELSFSAGDKLIIAPKNRQRANSKDWLLAALMPPTQQTGLNPLPPIKVGLIPANYVRVLERRLRQTPSNAPDAPSPQSSQPNPSPPTCQHNTAPSTGSQMSNTPAATTNPMTTATTSTPPLNTGNTAPAPFIFNAIPLEMQGVQPFINRGPLAVNNHPVDMQLIPVFHNPRCVAASGPLAVNSHPVGMHGMPFLHNPGCMAASPLAVNSHQVGMQGIPTLLSGAPASAGNNAPASAQAKKSKPRESGSDSMAAASPLAVHSHPVGMQGVPTPHGGTPASVGNNASATAQAKKSKPKESGSDSKPADGGQGA